MKRIKLNIDVPDDYIFNFKKGDCNNCPLSYMSSWYIEAGYVYEIRTCVLGYSGNTDCQIEISEESNNE